MKTIDAPPPEPWMADAVCTQFDPEDWFADTRHPRTVLFAIATCRTCPVQTPCLDYALRTRQDYGIWGATTEADRQTMRAGAA